MPNQKHLIQQTFTARSDPTRRAVVQKSGEGSATVSQLDCLFDMALPSFLRCLGVRQNAGLIVSRREGRSRVCSLNLSALKDDEDWMASCRKRWEGRLDRFEPHLET